MAAARRFVLLAAAWQLLLAPLLAQAPSSAAVKQREIPVEDVQVGQQGHAVTAVAGNRLERFDVTVLGVQEDAGNGFPLVLIETSGELIEQTGGVAAGMSGSPVYLQTASGQALLGAIGYVFPGSLDHVALVTPISAMRSAAEGTGWQGATLPPTQLPGYGMAVPVATPVLMAGATARSLPLLADLFPHADLALLPVQAAGSAKVDGDEFVLEPGSPIAVALVRGDTSVAAVGTVTTVEGNRVLAFGHRFLGSGNSSLAFAPAFITSIVATRNVPFKLANVGSSVLGAIEQDRPAALAGTVGAEPDLIPVTITLLGVPGAPLFEFEVAAAEDLYPTLVATGALHLLDRALGATHGGFAEVAWELTLVSGERVNIVEQVNNANDIAYATALLVGAPLDLLARNSFRSAQPARVSVTARLDKEQKVASLEEAVLEEDEVTAGDSAHVHIRLQPHRRPAMVRTVTVSIPADLEGELTLILRGGSVPRDTGDTELDEKEIDAPRSFGELLEALRHRIQASELIVEAITEEGDLLRLSRSPYPFVITGQEQVTLNILKEQAPSEEEGEEPGGAHDF